MQMKAPKVNNEKFHFNFFKIGIFNNDINISYLMVDRPTQIISIFNSQHRRCT